MRPEFFCITLLLLLLLQLPWPRSRQARFGVRLVFTLLTLLLWGYNAGFFTSFWGFEGPFYGAFSLSVLPLLAALFPGKLLRNVIVLELAFLLCAAVTVKDQTGEWFPLQGLGWLQLEGAALSLPGTLLIGCIRRWNALVQKEERHETKV